MLKTLRRKNVTSEEVLPDLSEEPLAARVPQPFELNSSAGHRNLLSTPEGPWAFWLLTEVDWPHTATDHRDRILNAQAQRWSELVGHEIYLLDLTSPFPHKSYAERLYAENPDRLEDREDARTFDDLTSAAQIHTIELGARKSASVLGIRLSDDKVDDSHLGMLLSDEPLTGKHGRLEATRRKLRELDSAVRREAFEAQPLTARSLGWVLHATVGMGAPVPGVALRTSPDETWNHDQMAGFTNPVYPTASPYAPTTVIRTMRDSKQYTRHVAVLHADVLADREANGLRHPWLSWAHTVDQEVVVVARGYIVSGKEIAESATVDRRKAKNIAEHYEEHDDDPPLRVRRGIDRARETEDEVNSEHREISTRFHGVVQFAVMGDTEDDALENARALTAEASEKQKIELSHDYAQFASWRSFIPGETAMYSGHLTRMPTRFLAAGVPNASTSGGDPTGFLVGNIAGGHDVFLFDLFGGAKRDTSNVLAIGGDQGAGKSSFAAALMDFAATCGIRTVGYDPSGPWAELTKMPHLKNEARHLDLSSAKPGTLVPHLMIPEPRRVDFDSDDEYREAVGEAATERMELCIDSFRDMLPYSMVAGDRTGAVAGLIEKHVTKAGGAYGTDPWQILDSIRNESESTHSDLARAIAERLESRTQLKDGALVFPTRGKDVSEAPLAVMNSAVFTVITMNGLTMPPRDQPNRETWSRQQQQAVPIVNLGSRFAQRIIYADKDPKVIMSDELGLSTGGSTSFNSFLTRSSYDSRKWMALIGMLFQNPNLLTRLDDQITNLLGSVWIGRMGGAAAQAALPLVRLPEGRGFDQEIARLEQGEFVVRHWDSKRKVRRVRVDRDWWHEDFMAASNTTAGGAATPYDEGIGELFGGVA